MATSYLGGGKRLHMSERGMRPPVTLGHEPFGTVIAAGGEADGVPIGADRLVHPWTGCGYCARCREGLDNYCMAPSMLGTEVVDVLEQDRLCHQRSPT